MTCVVHLSDCVKWLQAYEGPLFDAVITDAPYHLSSIVKRFGAEGAAPARKGKGATATGAYARASRGFMGKTWDGGDVAFRPETWAAIFDKMKPGAHLIAFSGTRTYHRMACAIEDAGFEIRDQIQWLYGSGFPKSHDISKGIDRVNGDERPVIGSETVRDIRNGNGRAVGEGIHSALRDGPVYQDRNITAAASAAWEGWGTALKPAVEPICLARKPISESSIAANVLKYGTGAINIGACRIDAEKLTGWAGAGAGGNTWNDSNMGLGKDGPPRPVQGRWPANVVHDGSDEVVSAFPDTASGEGAIKRSSARENRGNVGAAFGAESRPAGTEMISFGDSGSAGRFFYSAKAGPLDRLGSTHATVKPVDLMRWLVRLVTPPGGLILDPFAGSGTTGIAAMAEGFDCTMIELEAEHVADIQRKLAYLRGEGAPKIIEHRRGGAKAPASPGRLFEFGA